MAILYAHLECTPTTLLFPFSLHDWLGSWLKLLLVPARLLCVVGILSTSPPFLQFKPSFIDSFIPQDNILSQESIHIYIIITI